MTERELHDLRTDVLQAMGIALSVQEPGEPEKEGYQRMEPIKAVHKIQTILNRILVRLHNAGIHADSQFELLYPKNT